MSELELLEHYKKMRESNIVLDFQGAISQEILVKMVEIIKSKFSNEAGKCNITKRIFSIFVEMAQNIAKYSAERSYLNDTKKEVGAGIIVVIEKNKKYTIASGNLVKKNSISPITEHLQKINRMDKEELKQFYKKQIRSDRENGKDGAGLGFIEIARKSGNPINYRITPVNDLKSFLILEVRIREEKKNG